MKEIFIFCALVALFSCGRFDRCTTHFTGNLTYKCSKSGVEYAQADSGIALHVERNGKPIPRN